jgi:hypothetical protein
MINSYQELAQLQQEHRLISAAIILPCMGDVVGGPYCYSLCRGSEADAKGLQATINNEVDITGTSP